MRLRCEGDSDEGENHGSSGGRRPPKKQSRKPLQWLRQALGGMRAQRVLRVSFNIGVLLMLMRFWPLTGRNPLNGNAASIPIEACMHAGRSFPCSECTQQLCSESTFVPHRMCALLWFPA